MKSTRFAKIPVTIITGFLGAGKTTFLNHILTCKKQWKFAVIVNEYAELSIDDDLLVKTDEEMVGVFGGCLCCSFRADLVQSIKTLMDRRDRFNHIIVETTGLARPGPTAQTFLMEETVKGFTFLNNIITVVDAKNAELNMSIRPETQEQIAFANSIILNKMDLVSDPTKRSIEGRLRAMNPIADLYESRQADIDPDKLLNTGAFDLSQLLENNPDFPPSDENHEDHANYSDSMQSISFEIEGTLDPDRVIAWFRWLHFTYGPNLVRTKGILSMDDSNQQVIFQGVYTRFDCTHAQPWGNKPRKSRIVLIGKELNREEIENELLKCKTSN